MPPETLAFAAAPRSWLAGFFGAFLLAALVVPAFGAPWGVAGLYGGYALVALAAWVRVRRVWSEGAVAAVLVLGSAVAGAGLVLHPEAGLATLLLLPVLVSAATVGDARVPLVQAALSALCALAAATRPGADPHLTEQLAFLVAVTLVVVTLVHDRRAQLHRVDSALDALRSVATRDELTGLLNRRGLLLFGEAALRAARGEARPAALLFLDVDGLKAVNDTQGHLAGDAVLREVARRLDACCRRSDLVARLGGDEYAVLLPGAGPEDADRVARLLRERLRGHAGPLTWAVSVGVSEVRLGERDALGAAIEEADARMYREKRGRRTGWALPAVLPVA
jgi:diguanylate cyclase (GGDEF)-like protein